ncbi:MAG: TRAP transporter substrate-binding protein DctP [Polyangiales bacterium]
MKRRRFLETVPAAAAASAIGIAPRYVRAQETVTLRLATLAPNGSSWMRVFNAWNNTLKQRTNNRLQCQFFSGGAAGDERDVIRKMRQGQLDGGAMTSIGLGQIVRPVLVLQVPGLVRTYQQMEQVRTQLAPQFEREFETAGYKLLGWGDAGEVRLFSNRAVAQPTDMRQSRFWAWRDDPVFAEVLNVAGCQPVALGLPEVYPALQTNRIDAFPASALAAVSFQWFNRATHVSRQGFGIIVGAIILNKAKWDSLSPEFKQIITETSAQMSSALQASIRRDDERAYNTVVQRGITAVDLAPHQAAWDRIGTQVRQQLTGRLYSADLLRRVEQIIR